MIPLVNTRAPDDAERLRWPGPVVSAPTVEFRAIEVDLAAVPARRVLAVTTPRSVPVARALAAGREVWALAPRTAAALEAEGVRVVRAVDGGVADLLDGALLADVVLLTSDLGVAQAARRWPEVAAIATHHTTCPPSLTPAALDLLASGAPFDVLLASPSAAANLEHLAPGALARARRVYCHGRSTLAAAAALHPSPEPFDLGA